MDDHGIVQVVARHIVGYAVQTLDVRRFDLLLGDQMPPLLVFLDQPDAGWAGIPAVGIDIREGLGEELGGVFLAVAGGEPQLVEAAFLVFS